MTLSRHISPTQVATAGKCGWAYEYAYVQRIKPPKTPVPLLTGTVLHRAHEKWALDHSLDMVGLTKQAWLEAFVEEPAMHRVIRAYQKLNDQAVALAAEIRAARPDIKVVHMTRDWKSSKVAKDIAKFQDDFGRVLEKDQYNWADKDFCQAYSTTIEQAAAYQERYRDTPEALKTEVRYNIAVGELSLLGVIDEVNILLTDEGEVLGYLVSDVKTYTKEPTPLKDWIQLAHYRIAAGELLPLWLEELELPHNEDWPIYTAVDLLPMLERHVYQYGQEQLDLAIKLTATYNAQRDLPKLPDFKSNCDYCEWREECLKRVGLVRLEVA